MVMKNEVDVLSNRNEDKTREWIGKNVGESGARIISESLKTNATLTKLNLSGDENELNEIFIANSKEWKNET